MKRSKLLWEDEIGQRNACGLKGEKDSGAQVYTHPTMSNSCKNAVSSYCKC